MYINSGINFLFKYSDFKYTNEKDFANSDSSNILKVNETNDPIKDINAKIAQNLRELRNPDIKNAENAEKEGMNLLKELYKRLEKLQDQAQELSQQIDNTIDAQMQTQLLAQLSQVNAEILKIMQQIAKYLEQEMGISKPDI